MSWLKQYAPAVVALVMLLSVGVSVIGAVDIDQDRIKHEYEKAQAYCYQAFGDPTIGNSMVIGNHGGWHCEANDGGEPHLHDVTDRAKMAAYLANESNRTVDQWPDDRYKPAHERGWMPTVLSGLGVLLFTVFVGVAIKYAPGFSGGLR